MTKITTDALDEATVERACRAICADHGWDADEPVRYSGTRTLSRNPDGTTIPQWRMHERDVRTALSAARLASTSPAPDGWKFDEDGQGFVSITPPNGESLHIGFCPQGDPRATKMLRDLACALLPSDETASLRIPTPQELKDEIRAHGYTTQDQSWHLAESIHKMIAPQPVVEKDNG